MSSEETKLSRRSILKAVGTVPAIALVGPAMLGTSSACSTEAGAPEPFQHGVASGDPTQSAVILWTRITTDKTSATAKWSIASDANFASVLQSGEVTTDASRDFTVKVDATNLNAGTTYYYRFEFEGQNSPVGRTKTFGSGDVARARFAVVSCSNYAHGYFHTYARIAEREDLDAVFHLGDYIYEQESKEQEVRLVEPVGKCIDLASYRGRYAYYRKDKDLQEAHRQHPFINVWDDHEFVDDAYSTGGDSGSGDTTAANWPGVKAAAEQAFHEWLPIRSGPDLGRIFRSFQMGNLADVVFLDTRISGRVKQAATLDDPLVQDTTRQLLGAEQEAFWFDAMRSSTAKWRLVAQQILMTDTTKLLGNADQWDGYPHVRARFLDLLKDEAISDVVVLAGDMHFSVASEIAKDVHDPAVYNPDTAAGSLAVEFATPGVSSRAIGESLAELVLNRLSESAPQVKYANLHSNGYLVLDIDNERAQAAWFHVEDVRLPEASSQTLGKAMHVPRGKAQLRTDEQAASPRADAATLAP